MARNGGYVYLNDDVYGNIKSFTALLGAAGSPGAAHGVDADGSVRINAVIQNLASSGDDEGAVPHPGGYELAKRDSLVTSTCAESRREKS